MCTTSEPDTAVRAYAVGRRAAVPDGPGIPDGPGGPADGPRVLSAPAAHARARGVRRSADGPVDADGRHTSHSQKKAATGLLVKGPKTAACSRAGLTGQPRAFRART